MIRQPCVIIHVRELAKPDFWHMVDSRYVFPGRGEIFLGDDAGNAVITKRCEKLVVHRFDQRMYKKLQVGIGAAKCALKFKSL